MPSGGQSERLEPGPLQTGILREIADRLLHLEDLYGERGNEGVVEPVEPVTVRGLVVTQIVPPVHGRNWFSVAVVNDGNDDVLALVNSPKSYDRWHRVVANETYTVTMNRPVITDVLLKCDAAGHTASVRVVGAR